MVRRIANEAVGDQIVWRSKYGTCRQPNDNAIGVRWLVLDELQHATRKRTRLAAILVRFVRTARHISRHRGHTGHLDDRQPLRRCWGGQRLRDEPRDQKDRKETTDESAKIHRFALHIFADLGRAGQFTSSPTVAFHTRIRSKSLS